MIEMFSCHTSIAASKSYETQRIEERDRQPCYVFIQENPASHWCSALNHSCLCLLRWSNNEFKEGSKCLFYWGWWKGALRTINSMTPSPRWPGLLIGNLISMKGSLQVRGMWCWFSREKSGSLLKWNQNGQERAETFRQTLCCFISSKTQQSLTACLT